MGKRIKRDEATRFKKMMEESAISIESFIKKCLGLYDERIMREKLTHKDLVKMFPVLERTSFDAIMDDPSCIYNGDVIIVSDAYNNLVPYISMKYNKGRSYIESDEFNEVMSAYYEKVKNEKSLKGQQNNDVLSLEETKGSEEDVIPWGKRDTSNPHARAYDLGDMSVYDLECLMALYTKLGQWHDYEVVRRELIKREDCNHANKKSKRKALERSMKRIKDDDEY